MSNGSTPYDFMTRSNGRVATIQRGKRSPETIVDEQSHIGTIPDSGHIGMSVEAGNSTEWGREKVTVRVWRSVPAVDTPTGVANQKSDLAQELIEEAQALLRTATAKIFPEIG